MSRPRNPIGTHGVIKIDEIAPGKVRARTRYRFSDGKLRQVERFGSTKSKAEHALKTALTTIEADRGGELKPTTTLKTLGQMFLAAKRDAGRSEGTLETYGYAVNAHIGKEIGDMSVAEATPERLQKFLTRIEKENGPGAAKNCRSSLSGMMGLAVRNGAISRNPVRELERISHRKKKGSEAIPLAELPNFIAKVQEDALLKEWDTVELIEFMLSTGWRVAEACALEVSSVDFKAGTATVEAIAKRLPKIGMQRQLFPKTAASARTTPLPKSTVELLGRRRDRLEGQTNLLFPTPLMKLRDPSNTQREIRDRREDLGYPELSTHSFRKTVATMLDAAGLSARDIAEYLGQANPSITQDIYMAKQTGSKKAAETMQRGLNGLF
ncbi:site-specific integrase [Leucobacter chromiireducens]|uniref:Site-specific integrase n=1 Tax=Leucobacter chromiireducens subsp. chromiireducens TaxID=660067 RepID=A0ABS1SLY2_9MICO|nr:site-specific integrase [Leucobacter chromiireducens]MBL3688945.1 site-specific integrase [Leucobacter chromiireducens subsp. chromiireducens]